MGDEGPSNETDDTEAPEGDENDEVDATDYPEDEGLQAPFDENDDTEAPEDDENNEDDADDETDETGLPEDDVNYEGEDPLQVEDDTIAFSEFAGNNEGGPGEVEETYGTEYPDTDMVATENPISEAESADAEGHGTETTENYEAHAAVDQMETENGTVVKGRKRIRGRTAGHSPRSSQPTRKISQGHGCHEKINMILKKVLKKLKMSQAVENKAYEMVEEMMMDRGIDTYDSDEHEY